MSTLEKHMRCAGSMQDTEGLAAVCCTLACICVVGVVVSPFVEPRASIPLHDRCQGSLVFPIQASIRSRRGSLKKFYNIYCFDDSCLCSGAVYEAKLRAP